MCIVCVCGGGGGGLGLMKNKELTVETVQLLAQLHTLYLVGGGGGGEGAKTFSGVNIPLDLPPHRKISVSSPLPKKDTFPLPHPKDI